MTTRPVFTFLALGFCLPALAGCGTMNSWMGKNDSVTVKNTPPSAVGDKVNIGSSSSPLSDSELRGLTRTMAGGSVEIYDIGGDDENKGLISIAPRTSSIQSIQTPAGIPYPSDPSVTIFPLDDFGVSGGPGGGVGAPLPHQGGASSLTPAPFVDTPNPAIGGKLSSTAEDAISRIYFQYGSDKLDANDKAVLKKTAEAAKFAPVDRVRVEGHASVDSQVKDPIRARILNLEESMNRAYAVSRGLIQQGVPAEKIKTVAWGDTVPAGSREAQRRVDIMTGSGY